MTAKDIVAIQVCTSIEPIVTPTKGRSQTKAINKKSQELSLSILSTSFHLFELEKLSKGSLYNFVKRGK
jgi:hypothetical protein